MIRLLRGMASLWTLFICAVIVPYHEGFSTAPNTNLFLKSLFNSNDAADSRPSFKTSVYGRTQKSKAPEIFETSQQPKTNDRSNSSTDSLTSLRPTNNADITRGALVRIIEESWSKVSLLIPGQTLILCEEVGNVLFAFQGNEFASKLL